MERHNLHTYRFKYRYQPVAPVETGEITVTAIDLGAALNVAHNKCREMGMLTGVEMTEVEVTCVGAHSAGGSNG